MGPLFLALLTPTPLQIPEVMSSLHHLVVSGKVLYLGISDTPAWLVVKCNDYGTESDPAPIL